MTLENDELVPAWLASASIALGFVLLLIDDLTDDLIPIYFAIIFLSISFILQSIAILVNGILDKSSSIKTRNFEIIIGLILSAYGALSFILIIRDVIIFFIFSKIEITFILVLLYFHIINLGFSKLFISIINKSYSRWFRMWLLFESLITLSFGFILLIYLFSAKSTMILFLAELCVLLGGMSIALYSLSLILKRYE